MDHEKLTRLFDGLVEACQKDKETVDETWRQIERLTNPLAKTALLHAFAQTRVRFAETLLDSVTEMRDAWAKATENAWFDPKQRLIVLVQSSILAFSAGTILGALLAR